MEKCMVCIGTLVLCLELYVIKLIQTIEKVRGSFYENIGFYFKEPIIVIPFIMTILVIIYNIYSIVKDILKITSNESNLNE